MLGSVTQYVIPFLLVLSVVVFEFIGTGLVLPFHVVYLHEVRGIPLSHVGLLLALPPLVGFLVVGPGGSAIDRFGARRILMGALALQVVANTLLAFSSTELMATTAASTTSTSPRTSA